MNAIISCLITASVMLTLASGLAALFFRRFEIVTPRLRQAVLFCVLLQGLMLFRMPIELPWLSSDIAVAAEPDYLTVGAGFPAALDLAPSNGNPATTLFAGGAEASARGVVMDPAANSVRATRSWSHWMTTSLMVTWLIGFAIAVLRSGWRYLTLCRLIDRLPAAPRDWRLQWEQVCESLGQRVPDMRFSKSAGPMLVRRPRGYVLVVPERFWGALSVAERRGVLIHEREHLRRRDVWRQLIARSAAALHWWNPAAWWCVRRYEESAEWACDDSLTRADPDAAKGLAMSLVRLVEFIDNKTTPDLRVNRGLGVQSMAAPPLTERVTRLLKPASHGDSVMKRLLLGLLTAGLLTLSAVQFRLVAADPDESASSELSAAAENQDADAKLRVLSSDSKDRLATLRGRLDASDKATSDLKALLDTEAGQVAFAGVIDLLENKSREQARGEAIPRFVEMHFESGDNDQLVLRSESRETAASWIRRSEQLGKALDSMRERMASIGERLDDTTDVNQLARRMLTDEQAGFALMLDEFDGRSDPIELFLGKALEKILVRRGDQLVVIPTLSAEGRQQIERFELATEVAERLRDELPDFAAEFAKPDERHSRFVAAMRQPAMAAVVALHMTNQPKASAAAAVDELFEQLEEISRDSADGLVIQDKAAWEHIEELMVAAERAGQRVEAVRERMRQIAKELDTSDPTTARFARQLNSGVIAYQVAVEVPYADFDLGKQIEAMVSQVMEPAGSDRLRVRPDAADQVSERAEEILTACRTIRRYLRRVDGVLGRMADRELADALDGPGRMLLLSEIRRRAEQGQLQPMELLEKEFFVVDESNNTLTVHPQRVELVQRLIQRAKELEKELAKDDF